MKSNDCLQYYLETLKVSNQELDGLINLEKIRHNLSLVEANLNTLNYLICNSNEELEKRIKFLFNNNKDCLNDIFILVATRFEDNAYVINGEIIDKKWVLDNIDNLLLFFKESKLDQIITSGKIKSFVDYVFGIEVGLDTNARKNRNGKSVEKRMYKELIEIFQADNNIVVNQQIKLPELKGKLFDFVISNKETGKKILVESSFYNTQGSKISETARSYDDLNKLVKENTDYIFIWLADGLGMNSIKTLLSQYYGNGYILNHKTFLEKIKDMINN